MKSIILLISAASFSSCTPIERENVEISNSFISPAPSIPNIDFYEEFKDTGEWKAIFNYRVSETMIGTWEQRGNEICVKVIDADVKSRITGKYICRSFYKREGFLFIKDVRDQRRELFVVIRKLGER